MTTAEVAGAVDAALMQVPADPSIFMRLQRDLRAQKRMSEDEPGYSKEDEDQQPSEEEGEGDRPKKRKGKAGKGKGQSKGTGRGGRGNGRGGRGRGKKRTEDVPEPSRETRQAASRPSFFLKSFYVVLCVRSTSPPVARKLTFDEADLLDPREESQKVMTPGSRTELAMLALASTSNNVGSTPPKPSEGLPLDPPSLPSCLRRP